MGDPPAGQSSYAATFQITNPDNRSASRSFAVNRQVEALAISSISPGTVTSRVPTWLTAAGTGFQPGFSAAVIASGQSFPILDAANRVFLSSSQVRVQVEMGDPPAGQSSYAATLQITNPDNRSASGSFAVNRQVEALAISSISPGTVTSRVPTWLTAPGTGFQPGFSAAVIASGQSFPILDAANRVFLSSSQVRVQVEMGDPPAGQSSYAATLQITNPDNRSASGSFTVNRQ